MRVLLVNQFYRPDHSATSQLLCDVAEHLARRGHHVTVLTGRSGYQGGTLGPARQRLAGVAIRRLGTLGLGKRSTLGRVLDYLAFYLLALVWMLQHGRSVDVVITLTTPPLIGVLGAMVKRLFGTRLVLWSMDVYPDIAVALGRMKPGCPLTATCRAAARWCARSADVVVAPGEDMARVLVGQGVDPAYVEVIDNWAPGPVELAAQCNDVTDTAEPMTVMYSGNMGLGHRFETILLAAERLADDARVSFRFVGGGVRLGELRNEVARRNLRSVAFEPYRRLDSLAHSLCRGDIHLVTQRSETLGLIVPSKVYGILAVGRPVAFIGPAESHVARLIERADCGVVIGPGDVDSLLGFIDRMVHDEQLRRDTGKRGRRFYREHLGQRRSLEAWGRLVERVGEGEK